MRKKKGVYVKGKALPPPGNSVAVSIERVNTGSGVGYIITQTHDVVANFWRDMTEQSVVEPSILEQNKRHLEQRAR